jgi:hypothetical protein
MLFDTLPLRSQYLRTAPPNTPIRKLNPRGPPKREEVSECALD